MKNRKLVNILFIIYCILLVWLILFKLSFSINEISRFRNVNLIPFYYDIETHIHLKEVLENIIIFIPFALYLKILNLNNKLVIIIGFVVSLLLEIFQYVFLLGATDITDIITNTTGTVLGVLLYIILNKIFKDKNKVNKFITIFALIFTIIFILLIILLAISNM